MIHTTRFALANRTIVLDNVDLIVAPARVQGDWIMQVVFKSGHITTATYDTGSFQTAQAEINNMKADMFVDYDDLLTALGYFHEKHGNV